MQNTATDPAAELLPAAVRAALAAGERIMAVYETDFGVDYKADESPLTRADTGSHRVIAERLAPLGIPLLSEEGRDIPYEERRRWRRLWVVDPLDGTKEFVKRRGEFTVNIALVEDGRPAAGVIYVPVKRALYAAARGLGAFRFTDPAPLAGLGQATRQAPPAALEDLLAAGERLPAARRPPSAALAIVGSRSHGGEALERYVAEQRRRHGTVDFVSAGSSLKFCLVAEGTADLYPRLGPTMEWDTAAGQAIAEQAGAEVLDHDSGAPLTYNKPDLLNPWFVVRRRRQPAGRPKG